MTEHDEPAGDDAGTAADPTCAQCGAALEAGQQFCTTCGAAVPAAPSGDGLDASSKRTLAIVSGAIAVLVVIALATSGGRDDSSDVETAPSPTEDTVATTVPLPTTTTIPVAAGGTWVVSGNDERGYSSRVTLAIGTPRHADPSEDEDSFDFDENVYEKVIKACAVTEATDAIVPIEVTVANTTANFPELLGLQLNLEESFGSLSVESDTDYESGPVCTNPNDSSSSKVWGLQTLQPVEAGASDGPFEFLLVLHNYYSPVSPEGDVAAYQSLRLAPQLTFGDTFGEDARRVTAVSISRLEGTAGTPSFQLVAVDDDF